MMVQNLWMKAVVLGITACLMQASLRSADNIAPPPPPPDDLFTDSDPFDDAGADPFATGGDDPFTAGSEEASPDAPVFEPTTDPAPATDIAPPAAPLVQPTVVDPGLPEALGPGDHTNAIYDPSYDQHFYIEAQAMFNEKQYEQSAAHFRKIPEGSPYFTSAMTYAGLCMTRLQDYGRARGFYRLAAASAPGNSNVQKRLQMTERRIDQARHFGTHGPVKTVSTYVRSKAGSPKIKEMVSEFQQGNFKIKETDYDGKGKIKEIRTFSYFPDGTLRRIYKANAKGNLTGKIEFSHEPSDATGVNIIGDVYIATESDAGGALVSRTIDTDFDAQGRPGKRYYMGKDGISDRRDETAWLDGKILVEIFEGGELTRRDESELDQWGNAIVETRNFQPVSHKYEYDVYGNWIRRQSEPATGGRAVVERSFEYFSAP